MIAEFVEFLKSIPLAAWTAFIAFFGVWLTNWNNRQSLKLQREHDITLQNKRISKERLEELHILVGHWSRLGVQRFVRGQALMYGDTTLKQYHDTKFEPPPNYDYSRLEMIVGIYGEAFSVRFQSVRDVLSKIKNIEDEYIQTYEADLPKSELIEPYAKQHLEFMKAINLLKNEIVKAAKEP
ncbi:hypothetical protein [Methylophilus sp. Leaf414]|uniref:hypothetical protein n=1 Tax=Methylophilus sp. Leaf414 TaxID=1736371 RepID=UPI0007015441|nr:hypothetical protein [Methylophilus sp. Leaf414]KQT37650.1 hypothetical protein ASG24_01245 [Methylophilus sp. Leaf414]